MSSGKTHAKASLSIAIPATVGAILLTNDPLSGLLCGLGCALGVLLSPDLDVDHKTISETILPEPLETLFYLYWYIYAKIMKHRSKISHAPLISTTLRVLYAFWWLIFVDISLFWTLRWVWIGLAISDFLHWLMDL